VDAAWPTRPEDAASQFGTFLEQVTIATNCIRRSLQAAEALEASTTVHGLPHAATMQPW